MRLTVQHTETFTFRPAVYGTIQVARLTPRDHTGHYVCEWAVEVDADCKLTTQNDAFGNIVTSFSIGEPLEKLTIRAHGEVETEQHHGIVRGSRDSVPMGVFLRMAGGDAHEALGRQLMAAAGGAGLAPLDLLHRLKAILHRTTRPAEGSGQSQAQGAGQVQRQGADRTAEDAAADRLRGALAAQRATGPADLALVLCNAARIADLPARLVSGYRLLEDARQATAERAVWAEAHVEGLGWIGFDPVTDSCPAEEAVRVAVGLEPAAVAAVRFSHHGHAAEEHTTRIAVARAAG